jgi:hypothetical protein
MIADVRPGPSTVRREVGRPGPHAFRKHPQTVRSACGFGWDWAFPSAAPTRRTFQPDKRDSVRLAIQVHRFRDISCTAAIRAVVRMQPLSPLSVKPILTDRSAKFPTECFALRITNKISDTGRPVHDKKVGKFDSRAKRKASISAGLPRTINWFKNYFGDVLLMPLSPAILSETTLTALLVVSTLAFSTTWWPSCPLTASGLLIVQVLPSLSLTNDFPSSLILPITCAGFAAEGAAFIESWLAVLS